MAESNSRSPIQILERCRQRAAEAKARAEQKKPSEKARSGHLKPERHKFFIADIFGVAPKDDNASMEHPLFALRAGDKRVRTYERNGNSVTVKPGFDGCATIHDKDLLGQR